MSSINRIYQVVPYYPPHLGGMENCAEIIAKYFANKNLNVTVLTSNIGFNNRYDEDLKSKHLVVKYLSSIEFAHTPFSLKLFTELLKIPKNSIVHLHVANAFYPEMVYLASKFKKFSYIAHIHIDVEGSGKLGFLLPLYKKLFLKLCLKNARHIICLTETFKEKIIRDYKIDESKITIIPNGVNDNFFVHKNKKLKGNNILFVGRLTIQKNILTLISSISKLKNKATLNIVGEGDQKIEINKLIKHLKLTNVIMHGIKRNKDLVDIYKAADIFVLPSRNEGMSLAMLEAMAASLPIIGAEIPQTKDFIKKGAILLKSPTDFEFAKAIDKLIEEPKLRHSMGEINHRQATTFKWENSLQKINDLYRSLTI